MQKSIDILNKPPSPPPNINTALLV